MNHAPESTQSRLDNEADFHDARINTPDEHRLGYVYRSVADVYSFCTPPDDAMHGSILELGCFRGDEALALHDRGFPGSYAGIDISPASIEHCQHLGLPAGMTFSVDDANVLETVDDASVDYAFGNGVLHHLDLPRFAPALARKLAPQGRARFIEPAQGNLPLRLFRRLTPTLRTPDEYPFDSDSIALLRRYFEVSVRHKALLRPILPMLAFNSRAAIRLASKLDDRLLRLRFLQGQAWLLQIELAPLAA